MRASGIVRMAALPEVRLATADDLPAVVALSGTARAGSASAVIAEDDESALRHLSVYLAAGYQIYVAHLDDELVGFVLCRLVDPLFFAKERSVIIDIIFVAPTQRRRGIGHALMTAVVGLAASRGAPYIYAMSPTADRGMQRFLARLSFAPAAGHRVVSTAVLARKLSREDPITQGIQIRARTTNLPTCNSIDELIAKRKRARVAMTASTGEQPTIITGAVSVTVGPLSDAAGLTTADGGPVTYSTGLVTDIAGNVAGAQGE